jgi:hypothetical protein
MKAEDILVDIELELDEDYKDDKDYPPIEIYFVLDIVNLQKLFGFLKSISKLV